jgi:hypothetical protein
VSSPFSLNDEVKRVHDRIGAMGDRDLTTPGSTVPRLFWSAGDVDHAADDIVQ